MEDLESCVQRPVAQFSIFLMNEKTEDSHRDTLLAELSTEPETYATEILLCETEFYKEISSRYARDVLNLPPENRFWMSQYDPSLKWMNQGRLVRLFNWEAIHTNNAVRSETIEIQEMIIMETFFQNRYFGARTASKRRFTSIVSLVQSWSAFQTNVKNTNFSHAVTTMLKFKAKYVRRYTKGLKIFVHDLSRSCGLLCAVMKWQNCPMCLPMSPKLPQDMRTDNQGNLNKSLRLKIRQLDTECEKSIDSDAEMGNESEEEPESDIDVEPVYVPAAMAHREQLFTPNGAMNMGVYKNIKDQLPKIKKAPSHNQAECMRRLCKEQRAREDLQAVVARLSSRLSDLTDKHDALVRTMSEEGILRTAKRKQ